MREDIAGPIALFSFWLAIAWFMYATTPGPSLFAIAIAALLVWIFLAVPFAFCAGLILGGVQWVFGFRKDKLPRP